MKILLTDHKSYIGTVRDSTLMRAGHEIVGFDSDLYQGCVFGKGCESIPEIMKYIHDSEPSDLKGFDAVIYLTSLSNDPR